MHTMAQPDPLGKYFIGSIGVHAAIAGLVVLTGLWKFSGTNWGAEHASTGSVGVTMVSSIPIPRKDAPENPLANDSESNVPQAPAPVKTQPQVKVPEPKAIPIPDKLRKISPRQQSPSAYRPQAQAYRPNQVYSQAPQAVSSKAYGIQGSAGIDVGEATTLGFKFGAYVNLMHSRIAGKWNTADVHAGANQHVVISFKIGRSGAVSNVKISQPSGSYDLDASAQRAVIDANPLPPLPADYDQNEATVELWFQLK